MNKFRFGARSNKSGSLSPVNKCVTNFTRCASPPLRVGLVWPNLKYPRPVSHNACKGRLIRGTLAKNSIASSTDNSSTCAMFFPPYSISSVSRLNRQPSHTSHFTNDGGKKFISSLIVPAPSHCGHRPCALLKENRLGE